MSRSDSELLESYKQTRNEDAFAELVSRYSGLVYSAALRQLRSAHLAEEAAQCVFKELAQKCPKLNSSVIVPAWLYRVTRNIAVDIARRENRRQNREAVAFYMHASDANENQWELVMPLLDNAMASLREKDRTAMLLRFFEKKSFQEIAAVLGASEAATQKRINRAVEQLRKYFKKRSLGITASSLSGLLLAHSVEAIPSGLAQTILSASLSTPPLLASGAPLPSLMSAAKMKIAVTAMSCALLSGGFWFEFGPENRNQKLLAEARKLSRELGLLTTENKDLKQLASSARSSKIDLKAELERLRQEALALKAQTNQAVILAGKRMEIESDIAEARRDSGPRTVFPEQNNQTKAESAAARGWALAARRYAAAHEGKFPLDLILARGYFPRNSQAASNDSSSDFEIVSQLSASDFSKYARPDQILVVRQKQAWRNSDGRLVKAYGFLDGSSAVLAVENDRFQDWEALHCLPVQNR